jgi:hypothetical protein
MNTSRTQRSEKPGFLEKLNVFSHRYPFPKAVDNAPGSFRQLPPETISFTDIETLRQWLNDLRSITITNPNALMFLPPYDLGMIDKYLSALVIRDKRKIEQFKSIPFLQSHGEKDPYKIINDFIKNIELAADICASTSTFLDRADKLKASLISSTWTTTVLIIGLVVFFTGVCLPMVSSRPHAFLYIHLPLVYFISVYILMAVKVIHFSSGDLP